MNFVSSEPGFLARCLGYAGLVPFLLLAAAAWTVRAEWHAVLATALVGYGAVIASFLGGVYWGIAGQLPQRHAVFHYAWGVVPSLLGWVAVVVPASMGLPLLSVVLTICYLVDRRSYPQVGWAGWLPLRLQLTVVAAVSCALGAARV